jgi:multimeric flavodoxin WrbA
MTNSERREESSGQRIVPVSILGIVGSPRKNGNTEIMVNEALEGAGEVQGVQTYSYSFHGKKIGGCLADCLAYCRKNGACVLKDDFPGFMEAWLKADGVIFGAPVYHMGPPAQVKAAIDRLGNVLFTHLGGQMVRFNKVCGAVVQGSSRWGGQEITAQFLVEHFLTMNCLPIAGDKPGPYLGAIGHAEKACKRDSILADEFALRAARNMGKRVAETARIVQAGMAQLAGELPDIYFFSRLMAAAKEKPCLSGLD